MNKKLLTLILPIILGVMLVAAISYYAMITITLNINQPIEVTGNLEQTIDCDAGETCLGNEITVSNEGDESKTIVITDDNTNEDIEVSYVGELVLTSKDTSTWEPTTNLGAILYYTITKDNFVYEIRDVSGFNSEEYTLIYYKDAVVGLEGRINNPQPAIEIVSDIGNLPQNDDANLNADYSEAPDYYEHPTGAKLWLVPTSAINTEDNTLDWSQMGNFVYETDLVYYFDNIDGEYTINPQSHIEFYPLFEISEYAEDSSPVVNIEIA